jgi:hypothetical protein
MALTLLVTVLDAILHDSGHMHQLSTLHKRKDDLHEDEVSTD